MRKYPSRERFKLLIKPAKKNIHSFLTEIRKVFRKARSTTQADLIKQLNPKIRGWTNYHRSVVSKETFARIDNVIWHLSFTWAKRRHPDKSKGWVLQQYYQLVKGVKYRFSGFEKLEDGTLQKQTLLVMAYTPIRRHVKILQPAHPYDKKYDEYFEKRTSGKWRNNSERLSIESYINTIQQGKCPCCTETLKINQYWSISLRRKASQGGEYKLDNIDVVHDKCYTEWQTKRAEQVKPATITKGGLRRA